MNSASSQLSSLLTEAICMLCQNGVEYSENLRIQGLLVVTADSNNVQVIEISDIFPSQQATGVGSSGLCETEADVDYKPRVQMATQDFPGQSTMIRQKAGPSFHSKAGMRRGFHAVRPPVKRRGGSHGFPAGDNLSRQKTAQKRPRVKMEDTVILVDSPDNTVSDIIEPKVETGWPDATNNYQSIGIAEYPEAINMPGYHGTDVHLYSGPQFSQPTSGRHHHHRPDAVAHTVTSSDGANEQLAEDIKPFQLKYDEEQDVEDGGQSFYSPVGRITYKFM